ncbi:lipocalin family protein [Pseudoxanthomonas sp.]|uniref:lipocalin family protein n=1 Tax=Pseudoxanthomonas sp. TaxID=1871049 RepID=UPI002FE141AC
MRPLPIVLLLAAVMATTACRSTNVKPTIPTAAPVDVDRFMGDWYVIAHIPSFPEREAYAAVESYAKLPDGRIQTTFRFRKGALDGPEKTMHPVGTVRPDGGGAVWGMQFVWPIQAEYVIAWVDADYGQTIVGRSKRDYVWLMARTPQIPETEYAARVEQIRAMGYDVSKLRRVPH